MFVWRCALEAGIGKEKVGLEEQAAARPGNIYGKQKLGQRALCFDAH